MKPGLLATILYLSAASTVWASSEDEIQVYDDAINKPGEFGLDVHTNYVISGITTPAWVGDAPANHSFRVTPEFSYGLTDTWELGAYLPMLQTADNNTYIEGAKVRAKYIPAHADSPFYWGINGELGRTSLRSNETNWNFELRPILGYRNGNWHFTVNPILDFELGQASPSTAPNPARNAPEFAPAFRAVYSLGNDLDFGLEHYSELGNLNNILPYGQQGHVTFAVVDTQILGHDINFGVGRGNTSVSDPWTVKAIINFPLGK